MIALFVYVFVYPSVPSSLLANSKTETLFGSVASEATSHEHWRPGRDTVSSLVKACKFFSKSCNGISPLSREENTFSAQHSWGADS